MAEGLNRVMLLGNLGADPELRYGQSAENAVLKLRLATTESYFDKRSNERKERTDWHNVVVFGKRGEALQKILSKGSTIFVEGRIQTSSYDNKEGQKVYRTDIVATNIILAGGRGGGARDDAGAGGGRPGGFQAQRPDYGRGGGAPGGAPRAGAPARNEAPPADAGFDDDFGGGGGGNDDDIPF